MKLENKKGLSLKDAFPAVLIVSVVAILFVALIYVFTSFQTIPADSSAYTTINESLTVSSVGVYVANATSCGFNNFAVTQVFNASGTPITSGNYSTTSAGIVKNITDMTQYSQNWKVSYTNTNKGPACTAASTFTTNFSNQIPLIGLVLTIVLIAIVIGVLVTSFFQRKGERV